MLKSEELLEKYRAAEKSGATEPEQTKPEAEKVETTEPAATEPSNEPQLATDGNDKGQGTTEKSHVPEKDERTRYQRDFEKRLKRQERSHQAQIAALNAKIKELTVASEKAKPELKPEDFQSRAEFDEYKANKMRDSIKAEILEEQRKQKETEEAERAEAEKAQKRMADTFKTPEAIAEFQDTMQEFIEDEGEFLETDNGQLYQEFIEESPIGLIIAQIIAKSPKAREGLKRWSKDMMMDQLHQFERDLTAKIKNAQEKKAEPPKPAAPTKPRMPSTGDIGRTSASSGKFSAKEWLRKKYPEKYGLK